MRFLRRHTRGPDPSPQRVPADPEARNALAQAREAQRDVRSRRAQLAPVLAQIRRHLDENEIAATVAMIYEPRPR
jgi:hypothetical protein